VLGRLEALLLALGALAVMLLGLLIAGNVATRALLGMSLPDSVIMVQELMVAAILLPLAAATAARAHVSVEVVSNLMGARARSWLIVFGSVVGMLALLPLLYAGWRELAATWGSGSFYFGDLGLPKWPGRLLFVVGIAVCWLRLLVLAVRDTRRILAGGVVDDTHAPGEAD